jgi:hypothetical protein
MYQARSRFGGNGEDLSAQGFTSTFDPKTLEEDIHTCFGLLTTFTSSFKLWKPRRSLKKKMMIVLITQLRSECRLF